MTPEEINRTVLAGQAAKLSQADLIEVAEALCRMPFPDTERMRTLIACAFSDRWPMRVCHQVAIALMPSGPGYRDDEKTYVN